MLRSKDPTRHRFSDNANSDNEEFDSSNERTALLMDAHVEESLASTRPLSGIERGGAPSGRRPKRANRTSVEYGVSCYRICLFTDVL